MENQKKQFKMTINKTNYVDTAEEVIPKLKNNKGKITLTTTKIRNILSLTTRLYNEVTRPGGENENNELSDEIQSQIQYVRMRLAYEAGRDNDVKKFVDAAKLMENIKRIGNSRENLLLFCRYMEALTAFHRYYYEGKD